MGVRETQEVTQVELWIQLLNNIIASSYEQTDPADDRQYLPEEIARMSELLDRLEAGESVDLNEIESDYPEFYEYIVTQDEETPTEEEEDPRTEWQRAKDFILSKCPDGVCDNENRQAWYDRWVFSGEPSTQSGMVGEQQYKDATRPDEEITYEPPEDPNKEVEEVEEPTEQTQAEQDAATREEMNEALENGDYERAEEIAKDADSIVCTSRPSLRLRCSK